MNCCLLTLGCKVNQYESDAIAEQFAEGGYTITDDIKSADVCIINTCTVTNIADKKSRNMISRVHRTNPKAMLVITGCLAQRGHEDLQTLNGIDLIIGNADKKRIFEIVNPRLARTIPLDISTMLREPCLEEWVEPFDYKKRKCESFVSDIMHDKEFDHSSAVTQQNRTRAYLKIQDGCNMFCTYCAIPYARGPIRSRSLASIREEAEKLNDAGFVEVVLTGIHLMSYGMDFEEKKNIIDAISCFDGLDNIKRIRLGSLEPHYMTEEILRGLALNKRVCRHFHLALQSGSNTVLGLMKRKYTSREFFRLCNKIYHTFGKDTAITTDIMVGFPGETDACFQETLEFMDDVRFAKVHVFPYSRRSGTKADTMPKNFYDAQKMWRAQVAIEHGKKLERRYLESFIGKEVSVLIESKTPSFYVGCTDKYVKVMIPCEQFECPAMQTAEEGAEEWAEGSVEKSVGEMIVDVEGVSQLLIEDASQPCNANTEDASQPCNANTNDDHLINTIVQVKISKVMEEPNGELYLL